MAQPDMVQPLSDFIISSAAAHDDRFEEAPENAHWSLGETREDKSPQVMTGSNDLSPGASCGCDAQGTDEFPSESASAPADSDEPPAEDDSHRVRRPAKKGRTRAMATVGGVDYALGGWGEYEAVRRQAERTSRTHEPSGKAIRGGGRAGRLLDPHTMRAEPRSGAKMRLRAF